MYNRYFPYGLVSIATFLKENGFPEVQVYDADYNEHPENIDYSRLSFAYQKYLGSFKECKHPVWTEVENTIIDYKPELIGISIWTTFAASSFYTAQIAKKIYPKVPVVLGGPHATVRATEILDICPHVDFVIQGESEQSLTDLANSLKMNHQLDNIKGLVYRADSKIISNSPGKETLNLNLFPFPDRSLLINESSYNSEDMGLMMTSRGCPFACTYCATTTNRVSFRTSDHIISEIQFVKEKYGTVQFTFKDDSFTVNTKRVELFCNALISNCININWECNTRVNLINEELLQLMKKAGCNFIKVGVESGSRSILKSMNKGITLEQIFKAAKLFRKLGVHWTAYFMIGVPGETQYDITQTIEFMKTIRPDFISIGVYEPFPGTVMFDKGIKRGLFKNYMTLKDFFETLPNHYYKVDPQIQTDLIPIDQFIQLEDNLKTFVHKYNRNFLRILKMGKARSKVYLNNPRILWEDFNKFLSY